MTDERTPYVDKKVPKRLVLLARQSLRTILGPGEEVHGMFSVTRFRRSVSMLVVTDRRLLTLGDEHVGAPLVDEVMRAEVREVTIEREKVWTTGLVTAHTVHGEEVNLGTLTYTGSTFLRLDEVLARPTGGWLPTIPTPGPGARPGVEDVDDVPVGPGQGHSSHHPLIAHLTSLADLYDRGALTEAEFAAAKRRLLTETQPQVEPEA
ncbi:SHOCT domain-containing protein [Ornithinimicrobium pratense]|uniref:SHOCT domain-containing protein n=1 Tax=Ornithinimicrobium pratense TaxID=2593973 RepID=A0A5J6V3S0_9MICO|nr:SHOCT domain-containing protein [Ornithinimicrobium pratense]QFG68529.1 SHOCT domain-containing protein [Ornithinimicrobium pratense]